MGVLVAIAALVATAVWLGARGRTDDNTGTDKTTGDSSSQTGQQGQNVSVDQVAPETAPADGVVIPTGADQVDGYPTRFPQTDLGAVALQVEVAKAQVGFDYDQAAAVAGLYANPEDKAVFEQRARDAVALRRQQAGVPKEGDVPPPASYAVTPIAYTLEELDTGYYAVNLLSYVTLTTANGKVSDGLYAGTQLMRWLEVDGVGDWRLVQGSTADIEHLVSTGQPKAVAPGTRSTSRPAGSRSTEHPSEHRRPLPPGDPAGHRRPGGPGPHHAPRSRHSSPAAAAAAAEPATSTAASTAQVATVETTSQLPARNLKMGCLGPDELCDLGGDALECAEDPVDCGKDAAGGVKDEIENQVEDVQECLENPSLTDCAKGVGGVVPGVGGCGLLDAICDAGLPGIGLPASRGCPASPDSRTWGTSSAPASRASVTSPTRSRASATSSPRRRPMPGPGHARGLELRPVRAAHRAHVQRAVLDPRPERRRTRQGRLRLHPLARARPGGHLGDDPLGAAAFKREGKGLARAFIGAGQFVLVCACWFGYCVMIVAACGAITKALMKSLLKVQTWPDWDPLGGLGVDDITDAGVATALAFLGIFLWLAAIGHVLVYLARAASLLVLVATGPLSAAGLVSDFTRSWFWKSLRWFHAAAFTPVLMVMVLGIGVQFANGVAAHLADGTAKAFGTALPAVMTILVSVVAPLALFKLLAFVDPGTPSGASFRQGMAIQGGLQGLLAAAVPAAARRPRRPPTATAARRVSRAPRPRPVTGSTSPPRASSAASARSDRRSLPDSGWSAAPARRPRP